MANVTLRIGGRSYAVACQDGEEAHIASLGRAIDGKLATLGPNATQNEPRALLFAALLLADEAHELKHRTPSEAAPPGDGAAPALEAMAERLEKLAESLEA
ncbi:MAG: cell division protein ZapA [Novosphingobium sp.]|nr:cell division protein ZapA [Novosphingobium sp.]MBO9603024.1 cell division protein ZapA [Novosphingobium sp.]